MRALRRIFLLAPVDAGLELVFGCRSATRTQGLRALQVDRGPNNWIAPRCAASAASSNTPITIRFLHNGSVALANQVRNDRQCCIMLQVVICCDQQSINRLRQLCCHRWPRAKDVIPFLARSTCIKERGSLGSL